ncbi:MAG: hypothetical protein KA236_15935 [Verrucomicrobia bacterium]|nr:hypothetical protein [Verrucomicrobiota bacterium]
MSTAQKLYEKAQTLPEAAQETLLRMAELLAANSHPAAAAPKLSLAAPRG